MVARSLRIEIGAGGIQADADQLDKLAGQNGMSPWIGAHPEAELGPLRVPLTQRAQSRIPRTRGQILRPTGVFVTFLRFVAHDFPPVFLARDSQQKACSVPPLSRRDIAKFELRYLRFLGYAEVRWHHAVSNGM